MKKNMQNLFNNKNTLKGAKQQKTNIYFFRHEEENKKKHKFSINIHIG